MNAETFNRLHSLRMENDAAGFAMQEMRPRFDRMAGRHENGTAPRAVSVYQLFQTPVAVAAQLAALLDLKPGARVLEPSAGLGRLLDAVLPFSPGEVVAVEQAPECAAELYRQNRDGVTIKQRDFLSLTPDDLGQFDAVIMNPPFHLRADIRHIQHALRFVRPGGRLAAVCMDERRRREAFAGAAMWVSLPAGSFKESGTGIGAALVLLNA
jgi:predicted RNA methylase